MRSPDATISHARVVSPGTLTGRTPTLINYTSGTPAFKTDFNNLAPSLGLTYRPTVDQGFLRRITGQVGHGCSSLTRTSGGRGYWSSCTTLAAP